MRKQWCGCRRSCKESPSFHWQCDKADDTDELTEACISPITRLRVHCLSVWKCCGGGGGGGGGGALFVFPAKRSWRQRAEGRHRLISIVTAPQPGASS